MAPTADHEGPAGPDSGIFGLGCDPETAAVVLLPVPFDATTSYRRGTAGGPAAILGASHQVDLYDALCGDLSSRGIALLAEPPEVQRLNAEARGRVDELRRQRDAGAGRPTSEAAGAALAEINELCDRVNRWVRAEAERWMARGRIVGVIGGDHATPFGAIAAHTARFPDLGILHVDAHADLRDAYESFTWSHASIMHNVLRLAPPARLVQVAIRDYAESERRLIESDGRVTTFFMDDLAAARFSGEPYAAAAARIVAALPEQVYVSFDIDGLDPACCPNTGTPVPGGLAFAEAVFLLRAVHRSGRTLVGFDLNEVAPGPGGDEWDANVGARLLYQLCLLALASRR